MTHEFIPSDAVELSSPGRSVWIIPARAASRTFIMSWTHWERVQSGLIGIVLSSEQVIDERENPMCTILINDGTVGYALPCDMRRMKDHE